ncbi:MAG: acyl carrier protein [Geminicoccaceae bacterium]
MEINFGEFQDIVANQLNVQKESVKLSALLVDDLGADSLDAVELAMALEEHFDVDISDKIDEARTVEDIVEALSRPDEDE